MRASRNFDMSNSRPPLASAAASRRDHTASILASLRCGLRSCAGEKTTRTLALGTPERNPGPAPCRVSRLAYGSTALPGQPRAAARAIAAALGRVNTVCLAMRRHRRAIWTATASKAAAVHARMPCVWNRESSMAWRGAERRAPSGRVHSAKLTHLYTLTFTDTWPHSGRSHYLHRLHCLPHSPL